MSEHDGPPPEHVTIRQAMDILRDRGFPVAYPTVRRWCQRGEIPAHAIEHEGGKRTVLWLIDRAALDEFTPPKRGRRPDPDPSPIALAQRESRARRTGQGQEHDSDA